jgi:hypothetical protein
MIKYIKSGLIIDSDNDEIRTLASKMAQGEDDLSRYYLNIIKRHISNVFT